MKNETSEKPKCLVHYKEKVFLARQLDVYERSPIEEIGLITGYKYNLLNRFKLKKFHDMNGKNSNMIHLTFCSNQWLLSYECIISYSDIFFEDSAVIELMKTKFEMPPCCNDKNGKLWEKDLKIRYWNAQNFRVDNKNKGFRNWKKN